jgi:hypothetical protein
MKVRNVILLLVVAVALIWYARHTSSARKPVSGRTGTMVLPALDLNAVERVQIASSDRTVTIARREDQWVCPSAHNYPIQFDKLKNALIKMADLKVGQVIQADVARREELKLAAPSPATPKDKSGTLIELFGSGTAPLASLILGESRMKKSAGAPDAYGGYPDGRYLSADGGKTVYLVSDTLDDFSTDPKSWLDTEVWSLYSSDINEITIRHPGAQPVRLVKPAGQTSFVLEGLAPDEETDDVKAANAAGAFGYLRFDDVVDPSLADTAIGMTSAVVYSAVATNGQVYTATVGGTGKVGDSEGRYVRFQAALPPSPPTDADARKRLEQGVADINAKLAKWTFLVSNYKADSMVLSRDVLARKKPAETNAAPAAASAVTPPPPPPPPTATEAKAPTAQTVPETKPAPTVAETASQPQTDMVVTADKKAEAIAPTPSSANPPRQGLPRIRQEPRPPSTEKK